MTALPSLAIDAHRAALVRFVAARVDEGAAEDIVHDVFVRAYSRREQLRDETKLLPWLYQMTRNAIADHHRGRKPTNELPEDLPASENDDKALQELAGCLTPLIDQLPAHYRDAVRLSEIEGITLQETANRLGITLSGAKSRVQRARAKLQESLLACCHVELDHRGSIRDYECRGAQSSRPCSTVVTSPASSPSPPPQRPRSRQPRNRS